MTFTFAGQLDIQAVFNLFGRGQVGVPVTVYLHGTTTLATLWTTKTKTAGTTTANPFVTTSRAMYPELYVDPGLYDVILTIDGIAQSPFPVTVRPDPDEVGASTSGATYNLVADYGAKGDMLTVNDVSMTSGSNVATSPSAPFKPADVGKHIAVLGAGASANNGLYGVILSYISPTQVTTGWAGTPVNASHTVSGVMCRWGTDNGPAFMAAKAEAIPAHGELVIPAGDYYVDESGVGDVGLITNQSRFAIHCAGVGVTRFFMANWGSTSDGRSGPFHLINCTDFEITDFSASDVLQGPRGGVGFVEMEGCLRFRIKNVEGFNAPRQAVITPGKGCDKGLIMNILPHDMAGVGIEIGNASTTTDPLATNIEVAHVIGWNLGDDLIGPQGASKCHIHHVWGFNIGGCVYHCNGTSDTVFEDFYVDTTFLSGINIESSGAYGGLDDSNKNLMIRRGTIRHHGMGADPGTLGGYVAGLLIENGSSNGSIDEIHFEDIDIWGGKWNFVLQGTATNNNSPIGTVTYDDVRLHGPLESEVTVLHQDPMGLGGFAYQLLQGNNVKIHGGLIDTCEKNAVWVEAPQTTPLFRGLTGTVEVSGVRIRNVNTGHFGSPTEAAMMFFAGSVLKVVDNIFEDPNNNIVYAFSAPATTLAKDKRIVGGNTYPPSVQSHPFYLLDGPIHYVGATGEPAFQNSWVNYGSGNEVAGFYKDPWTGRVHLSGTIKTGATGTTAFTLPAGMRPTLAVSYPAGMGGAAVGLVAILTTGEVQPSGAGVSTFVRLDAISFLPHD